jgi:DNA uptake protein ComE-like DNA-binding protein
MTQRPRRQRLDLSLTRANLNALWLLALAGCLALALADKQRNWFTRTPPAEPDLVAQATERIDPNTASQASLMRLPGIGPALAEAICQARSQEPFTGVEDLQRVDNIGPVTASRLAEHLTFAPLTGGGR